MIEVAMLTGTHEPIGEGFTFELVADGGKVLGSGQTDAAGLVKFDVDSAGLGPVAIRLVSDGAAAGDPEQDEGAART